MRLRTTSAILAARRVTPDGASAFSSGERMSTGRHESSVNSYYGLTHLQSHTPTIISNLLTSTALLPLELCQ